MKKNFVLDTNVLLHDSNCLTAFEDNVVNIPIYVIEELDIFKKDQSELGRNARQISRELDRYRASGNLLDGVATEHGGVVRVLFTAERLPEEFAVSHTMDSSILSVAVHLRKTEPDTPVIFVTKDTNLRIRADALGIHAEDYDRKGKDATELYTGSAEFEVEAELIDRLFEVNTLALSDIPTDTILYPNQFLTLTSNGGARRHALARVVGNDTVEPLRHMREPVWGLKPRNREQHFALDMLLRDEIELCTLVGKAGTGKTLLALAAGMDAVVGREQYRKLLVSRPIFPMGRDLGFLPGDLNEKLGPWMQPIRDNVEFLTSVNRGRDVQSYDELVKKGIVEVEALTYIRGRSLPNQFIIVDEAQNLTPHEVKTVLTRVGQGTKLIFTGDPYQIDQPYLDASSNGLTFVVERFKGEAAAGHITLQKGERSRLAELAANLL